MSAPEAYTAQQIDQLVKSIQTHIFYLTYPRRVP